MITLTATTNHQQVTNTMPESYQIYYLGDQRRHMQHKQPPAYVFGKTKVHPAPPPVPSLDPAKAPWSAPRGYTTSLPEEAAALKRRQQSDKPAVLVASKHYTRPAAPVNRQHLWIHRWAAATKNHFAAILSDMRAPGFFHRLIGVCCCIRADVAEAIDPRP
jgi:hypothetical protein